MLRSFLWPAFIIMLLVQWWVPGQMIWDKEKVLRKGTSYKFQSAPVDPADPFRGRYITLRFKEDHLDVAGKPNLAHNSKVYVTFNRDADGFAQIQSVQQTKPAREDYLETTVSFIGSKEDSSTIYLEYPFSIYYMEESKAPQAESLYRKVVLDSSQKTYALVNLLNGAAAIKDVYINDTLIQEVIKSRYSVR